MSDLIVIGYPDEETAMKAWQEVTKLERDYLIDLEDAAIVRRDRKGKLHVTTPAHHAVTWGTLSGLFRGTLIGLLRTSLTHDAEQHLMRALHGDDQAAATWAHPRSAPASD